MSDSVTHRWQPTRLPRPWDSPGKNTGVGCHFLLQCMKSEKWKWSRSVVSDSLRPHGPQPTRLLCPWDFLGKSSGVGCHCLLRWLRLLTLILVLIRWLLCLQPLHLSSSLVNKTMPSMKASTFLEYATLWSATQQPPLTPYRTDTDISTSNRNVNIASNWTHVSLNKIWVTLLRKKKRMSINK